jgi:hypothetical protein
MTWHGAAKREDCPGAPSRGCGACFPYRPERMMAGASRPLC